MSLWQSVAPQSAPVPPLCQYGTHSYFTAAFLSLLHQCVFQCRPVGVLPERFIPLAAHSCQLLFLCWTNWNLGCWKDKTHSAVTACLRVWGLLQSIVWQRQMRTSHQAVIHGSVNPALNDELLEWLHFKDKTLCSVGSDVWLYLFLDSTSNQS